MRIRQIRNATLVIDYAGSRLLVDPWFEAAGTGMLATSPWPERNVRSPLVDLPCTVEEVLDGIDAVVVTHVHPDHFEEHSAALMDHTLPLYVQNEADAAVIAAWGFTDVRLLLDEGATFGGLTLTRARPARPHTGDRLWPGMRRGACGARRTHAVPGERHCVVFGGRSQS